MGVVVVDVVTVKGIVGDGLVWEWDIGKFVEGFDIREYGVGGEVGVGFEVDVKGRDEVGCEVMESEMVVWVIRGDEEV